MNPGPKKTDRTKIVRSARGSFLEVTFSGIKKHYYEPYVITLEYIIYYMV
jgi:hypothetical protein